MELGWKMDASNNDQASSMHTAPNTSEQHLARTVSAAQGGPTPAPDLPTLQELAELIASVLEKKDDLQLVAQCDGRKIVDVSYQDSVVNGSQLPRLTLYLSAGTRVVVTSQPILSLTELEIQLTGPNREKHILQFVPQRRYLPFSEVRSRARQA